MKRSWAWWWMLGAVGLTLPACRPDYDRKLLERELRLQEDRIYSLEDELEQMRKQVAVCRQQNAALLRRDGGGGGDDELLPMPRSSPPKTNRDPAPQSPLPLDIPGQKPNAPGKAPSGPPLGDPMPPAVEVPGLPKIPGTTRLDRGRRLVEPVIRPPSPFVPEDRIPEYDVSDADRGQFERLGDLPIEGEVRRAAYETADPFRGRERVRRAAAADTTAAAGEPITDYRVARIKLDRRLTGGWNADGRPGDEGIGLVLELRNAANRILPVPATVTVVLIDPQLPADRARVARWDVSPQEAGDSFRKSLLGHGMHLDLPWAAVPPTGRDFELHVRVLSESGEEFRTSLPVRIDPPLPAGQQLAPPGTPGGLPLRFPFPGG